ncbi:hypothetical protein K523DRAFT_162648, partial [Schizophyllum commune Tattone D]
RDNVPLRLNRCGTTRPDFGRSGGGNFPAKISSLSVTATIISHLPRPRVLTWLFCCCPQTAPSFDTAISQPSRVLTYHLDPEELPDTPHGLRKVVMHTRSRGSSTRSGGQARSPPAPRPRPSGPHPPSPAAQDSIRQRPSFPRSSSSKVTIPSTRVQQRARTDATPMPIPQVHTLHPRSAVSIPRL